MDNCLKIRQGFIYLLALLSLALSACSQSHNDSDPFGMETARQQLRSALTDTTKHNVINSKFIVLDKKDKAIRFAEQILFDIYGKTKIEHEKPYKAYNIDNYWLISGSLPEGSKGGTFLIIINSLDCKIIRLTHGK